jgi:hypothetical protein
MRGCRIDAIWRSRVANLGTIAYAFDLSIEVPRDGELVYKKDNILIVDWKSPCPVLEA